METSLKKKKKKIINIQTHEQQILPSSYLTSKRVW